MTPDFMYSLVFAQYFFFFFFRSLLFGHLPQKRRKFTDYDNLSYGNCSLAPFRVLAGSFSVSIRAC